MDTYVNCDCMCVFLGILVRTRRLFIPRVSECLPSRHLQFTRWKGGYQYRIIERGNRRTADKPCQNQIEFLMGASFIQWIVLNCIHPLMYWCLNKTCDFRERNLHELYSILTGRWWEVCVNYFSGVDHGTLDQGASLLTSNCLSSAMDSQSRIKGITFCCCCYFFVVFFLCNFILFFIRY